MFLPDRRPVYKNSLVPKTFDNALSFFTKFSGDCSICISYHEDPHIIPCGHTFCCVCIEKLKKYSTLCPICSSSFWTSKPTRFIFFEISFNSALFRRLETRDVLSVNSKLFFEFPYCCYYYEGEHETKAGQTVLEKLADLNLLSKQPCSSKSSNDILKERPFTNAKQINRASPSNQIFYQSADGRFSFLLPHFYRNYRSFPEYIFGTIKRRFTIKMPGKRYPELAHIPNTCDAEIIELL